MASNATDSNRDANCAHGNLHRRALYIGLFARGRSKQEDSMTPGRLNAFALSILLLATCSENSEELRTGTSPMDVIDLAKVPQRKENAAGRQGR